MFISIKIAKKSVFFFQAKVSLKCSFSCSQMLKCQHCLHFNIYELEKISCSVELSMKISLKPRGQ